MTKRIIKESLIDMLKKKSMDKITVSALCEEADINRSTFYSHYSDVCDVLEEMKTELIADYMPFAIEIDMKNHSIEKDNFMKFFECVKTQKDVLSVLVNNTSIINDVTQPMRKNIKNHYLSFWVKVPKSYEITSTPTRLILRSAFSRPSTDGSSSVARSIRPIFTTCSIL